MNLALDRLEAHGSKDTIFIFIVEISKLVLIKKKHTTVISYVEGRALREGH